MTGLSILDQLKKEHDDVKKLFKKAETCEDYQRSNILQEIKEDLIPHARGEEKTLYSLLKVQLDAGESPEKDINLSNEAYEEHRVADQLLEELENLKITDETWIAHLKVLKENIEHHIEEEEEELFVLAKKHFSNETLDEMKTMYIAAKDTYAESLPTQAQISEREPREGVHL